MLIHADQDRALNYLSTCIDQVNSFGDILQLVIVELIYKVSVSVIILPTSEICGTLVLLCCCRRGVAFLAVEFVCFFYLLLMIIFILRNLLK